VKSETQIIAELRAEVEKIKPKRDRAAYMREYRAKSKP
jgi:hypothetical protein